MRRHDELHARDLANVEAGLYPRELLFDIPVRRYLRSLPRLVRDTPSVVRRMRRSDYKDIPVVDKERYPAYYRRNFHWQTDGYFSEHSAEVYELGVELLFRGTADVMRRQVIPPITRFVRERRRRGSGCACSTSRAARDARCTSSRSRIRRCGCTASICLPRTCAPRGAGSITLAELTLAVENAEALPWADATFDIVTSVVHVPRAAEQRAAQRRARDVPRAAVPAVSLVIEDSAQTLRERRDRDRAARVSARVPRAVLREVPRRRSRRDRSARSDSSSSIDRVPPCRQGRRCTQTL